jgi:peptidoglycan hydrolase-like protein with peptidoglycan-binding domain
MRTALRFCLVMAWLLAALLPASGASVIFYSKADNAYGWCAGYSYSRGESCAREQCLQYGSACELAIECDGGWSATAFAPDPYSGFGASCEWPSAGAARSIALVSCIYASHTLCNTSEAFDGNARSASAKANDAFDLAWYTQTLLSTLGYDIGDIDGAIGNKTRAAIRDFQSAIGLKPTGEAEWSLMWYLTYVAGGPGKFVADTIASTDAADQHIVQTYSYRHAELPGPDLSLTEALANLDDQWRRNIVAALVTWAQTPCTVPARTAAQTGDATIWAVSCAEGDFLLGLGGGTFQVATAEDGLLPKPTPVTCPTDDPSLPGPGSKPSLVTLNGPEPGLGQKPSLNSENAPGPGLDYKPSLNTANTPGPLGSLTLVDCPPPIPADCPTDDPGKTSKPSLNSENSQGPGKDYKPSLNTANDPGPLSGTLIPIDCAPEQQSKPSTNTINGISPDLAGSAAN